MEKFHEVKIDNIIDLEKGFIYFSKFRPRLIKKLLC